MLLHIIQSDNSCCWCNGKRLHRWLHVSKTVCVNVIILHANNTVPGGDHIGVMRDGDDGEDGDGVMMPI